MEDKNHRENEFVHENALQRPYPQLAPTLTQASVTWFMQCEQWNPAWSFHPNHPPSACSQHSQDTSSGRGPQTSFVHSPLHLSYSHNSEYWFCVMWLSCLCLVRRKFRDSISQAKMVVFSSVVFQCLVFI